MTTSNDNAAVFPGENGVLARAVRKVVEGKRGELSKQEFQELKRHEKQKELRLRRQFYGSISQKEWREMSGRQTKVINEQAERYGLPFGGPTINLPVFVRKFHDFLSDNKYKLAREDDPLLTGGPSPALERYREEKAALAKLDRLERENQLVPRDKARQCLNKVSTTLRDGIETLGRQYGQAAVDIMIDALDNAQSEIDRCFAEPDPDGEPEDETNEAE